MKNFFTLTNNHIKDYFTLRKKDRIEANISQKIIDIAKIYQEKPYPFIVHDKLEELLIEYKSYHPFILQKAIENEVAFCITNSLPVEFIIKNLSQIDNQYFSNVPHEKVVSTKSIKSLELTACLINKYRENESEQKKLITNFNIAIFNFLFNPDGTYSTDGYNLYQIEKYKISLDKDIFWLKANFKYSDCEISNTAINQLKRVDEYLSAFNTKESEELFQDYMNRFLNVFNPYRHNEFILANIVLFENYQIEREKDKLDNSIVKIEPVMKKKSKI
jgi:hypothetical protein